MTVPDRAMVLAAGLGRRMRAYSDEIPKPLVPVAGRCLIDHALDRLAEAGVAVAVVNTHYRAEMIADHLAGRTRPRVEISHEPELLETGGGVVRALPRLGGGAFYVVNSDALWRDGGTPALRRLADAWDDDPMDALLLLHPVDADSGYAGAGDFFLEPDGRLRRRGGAARAPSLFAGVQILQPPLFRDAPAGAFSLNVVYDRALAAGRLWGLVHDGLWVHVGSPEGVARAEALWRGGP